MNVSISAMRQALVMPRATALPRGTERYLVRGGGALIVQLYPDDEIAIIDIEGRQRCELAVFAPDGRSMPEATGFAPGAPSQGINRLLAGIGDDALAVGAALRQRGLPGEISKAVHFFTGDSRAGEEVRFKSDREAIYVIHAVGEPMAVDAQDPPTDLLVFIHRARPADRIEHPLPPPLARVREEVHIDSSTARAYEVKAGEYIQIIDVAGRQCSDFLAFTTRQLEKGIERGLDATVTRTLVGRLYPGPGLYSKFFDQDMQPLVEVVRDTVGRHDTFALACTARYYDDAGYPGHVNCSDNFNAALRPYGVVERKGWPAINFFYNTGVDATNALYLDEPWSRPGDYVLVRALTDLVCASSACPDDIDPANGWNPTDIHVRIYPKEQTFSKAVAYRMTPDSDPQLTRETAFHPKTSALTGNFTEYRGFWLPTRFNNHGAVNEYYACREGVAIMDLSPLRKFEVLGPDAEQLMQLALTRDVRRLSVGQVAYTAMCYAHGGMIDDGTVFRLGLNNFRWIGGDEFDGKWLRDLAAKNGMNVWIKSSTNELHNVAVQGPKSRELLKQVIWTPPSQPRVDEIAWFHFTIGRIGDFHGAPVLVSRTGYSGELGYEVFCHPKDAGTVWDAIWETGKPLGLTPLGLEALDMLRIEAGLIFFNYEFTDQTDPFEAGIGFTVNLKTEEDFVGKEALVRRKAQPQRKLVGLELDGNEVAAHGDCVHVGRAQVGVVTSGTRSPILRKSIALARLDVTHAELGTEVEVWKLDGQKRLGAKVVRFPFYDPEKTRPRS